MDAGQHCAGAPGVLTRVIGMGTLVSDIAEDNLRAILLDIGVTDDG